MARAPKPLGPNEHRAHLKDGSSVILELTLDASYGYMGHGVYKARCCVLGSCLISAAFTPGRGFHDGSISSDSVGQALAGFAEHLYQQGELPEHSRFPRIVA